VTATGEAGGAQPESTLVARSLAHPPLPTGPLSRSRVALAAKAAVASVLAWYAAYVIPGAADYSYFGPFGAVIAMTFNVAESLRQCVRALVALGLGCGLAVVSELVLSNAALSLGLLVLTGVLLAGWTRLGALGGWIPFTAVLVLIVGGAHPGEYVTAYLGLTVLGGLIAVAVNIMVPPMPLSPIGPLDHQVRDRLADYYDGLAEQLVDEAPADDTRTDRRALAPLVVELWDTADSTADARRINLRAPRHSERAEQQYAHAGRLERLIHLTQEVDELVAQGTEATADGLDEDARHRIARVLSSLGDCLRRADGELHARRDDLAHAHRMLREVEAVTPQDDDWVLISIVVSARRCLQILLPDAFEA
jgi:uncharacterized membrane protein YgaE (UPF0421/DUF939 family)